MAIRTLNIYDTWKKLADFPGGKWVFSQMLAWTAPYSGSVGARVITLEPGNAVVCIHDKRRLRNHLGSIHAIALINLGELCSGLALYAVLPATHRGIITGISMQYVKKARGTIEAQCKIAAVNWVDDDMDSVLETKLYDKDGDLVATAEVVWHIGLKARKEPNMLTTPSFEDNSPRISRSRV